MRSGRGGAVLWRHLKRRGEGIAVSRTAWDQEEPLVGASPTPARGSIAPHACSLATRELSRPTLAMLVRGRPAPELVFSLVSETIWGGERKRKNWGGHGGGVGGEWRWKNWKDVLLPGASGCWRSLQGATGGVLGLALPVWVRGLQRHKPEEKRLNTEVSISVTKGANGEAFQEQWERQRWAGESPCTLARPSSGWPAQRRVRQRTPRGRTSLLPQTRGSCGSASSKPPARPPRFHPLPHTPTASIALWRYQRGHWTRCCFSWEWRWKTDDWRESRKL